MVQQIFLQRIGYYWPCVALASILANDTHAEDDHPQPPSLRDEASFDGLTYLQVIKYLPHADLYQARVASNLADLAQSDLLVFFTEEQLTKTLPWDCRLQYKRSDEIITAISAHAALFEHPCIGELHKEQRVIKKRGDSALSHHPLTETLEITHKELHDAMQATMAEQQENTRQMNVSLTEIAQMLQQALLLAALDKLMSRLWQTPNQARSHSSQAKCKLLALLRRWQQRTRRRVVNAAPRWSRTLGQVVFVLTIILPV